MSNPTYTADGDINPCRFVTMSGDFRVTQSIAGETPCGVSTDAVKADGATLAAEADDHLHVLGNGEIGLLELGGTVTAGDFLEPNADGKGVVADVTGSAANDDYGARALVGGVSGDKIRVQVLIKS